MIFEEEADFFRDGREPFDVYMLMTKNIYASFGFDGPTLWALSSSCLALFDFFMVRTA